MRLTFCTLCGEDDPTALEHHHYRPKALGGTDDETNMFTVCGTCHGMVHDIPRPLRLGELVKVGQAKIAERTVDDWQDIAAAKARQAEDAEAKALELAQQEARDATRALKRLVVDAKQRSRPEVSSPPLVPVVLPLPLLPIRLTIPTYGRPSAADDLAFKRAHALPWLPPDPIDPDAIIGLIGGGPEGCRCSAEGIVAEHTMELCAALLKAGHDPKRRLCAYRKYPLGHRLIWRIRSIVEGADSKEWERFAESA
jgi:hypothetical protein